MLGYPIVRTFCKPIQWICIPSTVLHTERLEVGGPCILAPTHISHLEPFIVSLILTGRIRWMARSEFYRFKLSAAALDWVGAFVVDRKGYPRPTLREAARLLSEGERVGVFPEAGVSRRQYSVMRGGPIKHGAAYLALRSQVPVIPIAIVGTHAMNRVGSWLPFHHAPVQLAIGEPIYPEPLLSRPSEKRRQRHELAAQMSASYQALYQELLELPGVDDQHDLHPHQSDDPAQVAVDPHAAAGSMTRRPQLQTASGDRHV